MSILNFAAERRDMPPETEQAQESDAGSGASEPVRPVFILGIMPRCGTNFLSDLLCLHPDCGSPNPIYEDYLLAHVDLLDKYVKRVSLHWNPEWGVDSTYQNSLKRHLGHAMKTFLFRQASATVFVSKTPQVENLDQFPTFFPKARLLILVRDGRAVIESGINTFRWPWEWALQQWTRGARKIIDFENSIDGMQFPHLVVRYEDLVKNLEFEMQKILEFIELNIDDYDLEYASQLPVRGSSTLKSGGDSVRWDVMAKPNAFDPLSRFANWSRAKHERYNWVAKTELEYFGYQPRTWNSANWAWTVWNRILDISAIRYTISVPVYEALKRWKRQKRRNRLDQQLTVDVKLEDGDREC
jgi:hypothetical protein